MTMAKGQSESKAADSSNKGDGVDLARNSKSESIISLSLFNTVLSTFLMVGIGAIVGYMFFASIYNHRCSDMMDDAERRFNETREELKYNLMDAMNRNNVNERAESELLALRGRIEGQADLMGKHQDLLEKHQATVEQLNSIQAKHDKAVLQSSQLERELQGSQKKVSELEGQLNLASVQKEASEKRLQQAHDKVKAAGDASACEASLAKSMAHIRALHHGICREKYGESPYYVQFDVEIDGEEDVHEKPTFIVEIETLDRLPHSVFIFLTLVGSGVYEKAEFLPTQSIIHLDSDESQVASLGYATSALTLVEGSSLGVCAPYSVGFVGANGGLKIIMTSDTSKHGSLACFGRIAQGRQTVTRIQRAGREGKAVSVTGVKTVTMASRPTLGEGEL